jgi:hypothetical protein
MSQHATNEHEDALEEFPPLTIPPYVPASAEEIARRQALAEQADRIREQLGPLGYSVVDIIREFRDEPAPSDCG